MKINPDRGKRIHAPSTKDTTPDQRKPKFSLEHTSTNNKFSLTKCNKSEKAQFADRLDRLSKLTWAEIKASPKNKLGTETLDKTCIRQSIPNHITEDSKIIALRCFGRLPMVGYKQDEIFFIIWFDRKGKLYDHGS